MLLEPVDSVVLAITNQTEGQLVALEQDSVRVFLFLCDGIAECAQGLLADDTTIGEPFPVGLDARVGGVAALVAGSLDNFAFGVALGLALLEDVELLDFLGGAVEVFSGAGISKIRRYSLHCVCAEGSLPFDLEVAAALLCAITHTTVRLLLETTHGCGKFCAGGKYVCVWWPTQASLDLTRALKRNEYRERQRGRRSGGAEKFVESWDQEEDRREKMQKKSCPCRVHGSRWGLPHRQISVGLFLSS